MSRRDVQDLQPQLLMADLPTRSTHHMQLWIDEQTLRFVRGKLRQNQYHHQRGNDSSSDITTKMNEDEVSVTYRNHLKKHNLESSKYTGVG